MKGELFINGKDAYTEWGISMDTSSLSALMTPAGNKDLPENKSRLEHGKRVVDDASIIKVDERQLTLTINLTARTEEEFFTRYSSFCNELATGKLDINTKYQPDVMYRTIYKSCNPFSQFMRGIAHFSLRLEEPNPKDRNLQKNV